MLPLIVLGCCLVYPLYLLGTLVLGVLVCWLLQLRPRGLSRMALAMAALYVVSEFFATVVHRGHISSLGALILGVLALGLCLGSLLRRLWLGLRDRRKGPGRGGH